jgi:hypothetical protein
VLAAVAQAAAAARHLPLDPPFPTTTLADLIAPGEPGSVGPRTLAYGSPASWHRTDPSSPLSGWRTLPMPEAASLVGGLFRSPDGATSAGHRLWAAPDFAREAVVAVEWMDARTMRWALGPKAPTDDGSLTAGAVAMTVRMEGDRETVARGARTAWQALELSGARPWRLAVAPTIKHAVHPQLPDEAAIVTLRCAPEAVPGLYADLAGTADLLGASGARAWPPLGTLFAYLPAHPRQAEAITWLHERASAAGGQARRLDREPPAFQEAAPRPSHEAHRDDISQGEA